MIVRLSVNKRAVTVLLLASVVVVIALLIVLQWHRFLDNAIDRNVYISQFLSGNVSSNYLTFNSIKDYITNEYLWNAGVYKLDSLGLGVNVVLNAASALVLLVACYVIFAFANKWYIIFLLNPLFLGLAFSQIRIALAFALLCIAAHLYRKSWKLAGVIIAAAACSIHTVSLVFIVMYCYIIMTIKVVRDNEGLRRMLYILFALGISFMMGPLREIILSYIGDRRAEYPNMTSSIGYMSFWWVLLVIFTICKRRPQEKVIFASVLVLLAIACFNEIFHFYSSRFLALALPLIAVAVYGLRPKIVQVGVVSLYILYTGVQWIFWYRYGYVSIS